MTTEAKFKHALKEMMESRPLSDINVTALCKKCGCHRQTFYYHYQDIYDLLASIMINEQIKDLEKSEDPREVLDAVFAYVMENFRFLKSVYASAASDLPDDFFYSRIRVAVFNVFVEKKSFPRLSKDAVRVVSRRYARMMADEFGFLLRDASIDEAGFAEAAGCYIETSLLYLLPALAEVSAHEKGR